MHSEAVRDGSLIRRGSNSESSRSQASSFKTSADTEVSFPSCRVGEKAIQGGSVLSISQNECSPRPTHITRLRRFLLFLATLSFRPILFPPVISVLCRKRSTSSPEKTALSISSEHQLSFPSSTLDGVITQLQINSTASTVFTLSAASSSRREVWVITSVLLLLLLRRTINGTMKYY